MPRKSSTRYLPIELQCDLKPILAADLDRQLEEGACLLIIPVANEAVERSVCRTLLRFAADRVQAHDLPLTTDFGADRD